MKLIQLVTLPALAGSAAGQSVKAFPGSVISSASERVDVFFVDEASGAVLHKYHANPAAGWNQGFESMDLFVPKGIYPSATALGDQLHIFVNVLGALQHKFWDGTQWLPADGWETLARGLANDSNVAVTSRGTDRLHVVGKSAGGGAYVHKYYDGTAWKPDGGDLEVLGSDSFGNVSFASTPAINSWGPDRLDIVGVLTNGTLLHKFWDGSQWQPSASSWEQWGDNFTSNPTLTSWGPSRLDIWAINNSPTPTLFHRFWDGYRLSSWEFLPGPISSRPSITHWSPNRIDIFALSPPSSSYIYKFFDGDQWIPSLDSGSWLSHGPAQPPSSSPFSFSPATEPASIPWGKNNMNVFAMDDQGELWWQLWEGSQWLPNEKGFYSLGKPAGKSGDADAGAAVRIEQKDGLRVQDGERMDL